MPRNVVTRTLRDGARSFAGFAAYIVLMVAAIVSIYPSIGHNPSLDKLVKSYPGTLKAFLGFGGVVDYSSATGYLGIELFSLVLPALMIAAAVTAGARAIAGEEEQQTLDLLLANPISRRRLVLEKAAAVAALVALLALVAFASLAVSVTAAGMDVTVGHLAAAAAATGLLGLLYGDDRARRRRRRRTARARARRRRSRRRRRLRRKRARLARRRRCARCGRRRPSTSTAPSTRSGTGSRSRTPPRSRSDRRRSSPSRSPPSPGATSDSRLSRLRIPRRSRARPTRRCCPPRRPGASRGAS